uniref:olfactory receptor 1M1-like n=1 Tax=Panthera onca TaxID=9690 RepID=UPI0029531F61|nr:olfactory receptor 1M1-like [Panthera onca]
MSCRKLFINGSRCNMLYVVWMGNWLQSHVIFQNHFCSMHVTSPFNTSREMIPMEPRNQTSAFEFILLGLSETPEQETLLFALFLCMYVVMAMGNLSIILAISSDSHLHTPMYFFLANLSLVDFCLATNTVPKMLVNIQIRSKSISYACCLTQMYFFHFFDFCDLTPLLRLSCTDTSVNKIFVLIVAGLVIATPFICILASYARIIVAIMKVPSAGGRKKAFSTCSSHLSVVALFYGTTIGVYLCPSSVRTAVKEKASAVMYTTVTPMLNPFIYSLRNRDLKGALRKLVNRKITSSS